MISIIRRIIYLPNPEYKWVMNMLKLCKKNKSIENYCINTVSKKYPDMFFRSIHPDIYKDKKVSNNHQHCLSSLFYTIRMTRSVLLNEIEIRYTKSRNRKSPYKSMMDDEFNLNK